MGEIIHLIVYDPVNNAVVMMTNNNTTTLYFPTIYGVLTDHAIIGERIKLMFKDTDKLSYNYVASYNNCLIYNLAPDCIIQNNNNFYLVKLDKLYNYTTNDKSISLLINGLLSLNYGKSKLLFKYIMDKSDVKWDKPNMY